MIEPLVEALCQIGRRRPGWVVSGVERLLAGATPRPPDRYCDGAGLSRWF